MMSHKYQLSFDIVIILAGAVRFCEKWRRKKQKGFERYRTITLTPHQQTHRQRDIAFEVQFVLSGFRDNSDD